MPGRYSALIVGLTLITALAVSIAWSQPPNTRDVRPQANALDSDDITRPDSKIWVLDFRFKDPRFVKVNIPGRGCRVCMYLWYQIINRTGEPRRFVPWFELVTHDKKTIHYDQILHTAQEAISHVEDPMGVYRIKNSVTISADLIPPQRPDSLERVVTGVAIFEGVDPESNNFSIFVTGLSNGVAVTDPIPPSDRGVLRRKTLQLEFRRLGDQFFQEAREIHFVPPYRWLYRADRTALPK